MTGFYRQLLGSAADSLPMIDANLVRNVARVSQTAASELIKDVPHREIDEPLSSIDDSKAPGIDDFNSLFLKRLGML